MLQDQKIREVDLLDSSHALGKCGLFETERKMQTFRASYEDAAKAEVAARKLGWTENDSLLDFVEAADYWTGKTFETLTKAEAWLKAEIVAGKTMFGCGDIRALEPVQRRCRYCTCRGVRVVHEYVVEDTGIVSDETAEDQCCD